MKSVTQLVRYGLVGVSSNICLYLLYLLATRVGAGHKTAMTAVYALGIAVTFLLNRRWTFQHNAGCSGALGRYLASYAIGYVVNFFGLFVFVDRLGFAHQLVQGLMVFVVAGLLFVLMKFWVFPEQCILTETAAQP